MCDQRQWVDEITTSVSTIQNYQDALDRWFEENVKVVSGFTVIKRNIKGWRIIGKNDYLYRVDD